MIKDTSPPHWAYLAFVDLREHGAPRTHVLEFSRSLTRYARVTVVTPTPRDLVKAEEFDYAQIVYPRVGNPRRIWNRLFATIAAAIQLLKLHRRKPMDILYVRDSSLAIPALIWAKYASVKTVLEVNGSVRLESLLYKPVHSDWQSWCWRLRVSIVLALHRYCYHIADKIVAVTDGLRQELVSEYGVSPEMIGVFANGANVNMFYPQDPEECRQKLNLSPNARYIGFVGNLFKWHGVDDLIVAFSAIAAQYEDTKLLIVGEGTETRRLKSLVQQLGLTERVDFVGRVPYNAVVLYINACEFCVGPFDGGFRNRTVGFSALKIYEYLACGKPVLASDLPDLTFIADEKVGRLYPAGNIDALAENLKVMLSLPHHEIRAMGMRARRLAVERFSWDATVKRVFDFIKSERVNQDS